MYYTISSITPICTRLREEDKSLVLATGFFDLLHEEHVKFLQKAKAAGDILIVGIESDVRARAVKGQGRPIQTQNTRAKNLAPYADYVLVLPDDFDHQEAYESLLAAVKPHIYAVSSHTNYLENKQKLTEKYGGKLEVVHQHNPAVSTSQVLLKNQKPV